MEAKLVVSIGMRGQKIRREKIKGNVTEGKGDETNFEKS